MNVPLPPVEYTFPATALHGSVGYDRPLDNYLDVAVTRRLVTARHPRSLYDTVANAHDARFQSRPRMFNGNNPINQCKCLPNVGRERRRHIAALCGNSRDYRGLGWECPSWRPRRSSYEDRRGAVSVTLAEICSLPYAIGPLSTVNEYDNTTAVYPPDEEHLGGLDDHVPHVDDEMDFEFASDDTFDVANTNVTPPGPPGPHRLPLDCNSVFASEPRDALSITCTQADAKSVDQPEWNSLHNPGARPHALENPSKWILPRTQLSFSVSPDGASSAMSPASAVPCARDLTTGNSLYQAATEKLSAPQPASKKAEMIEDTARISITAIDQSVMDTPRVVSIQGMHSPVPSSPSSALPSGQDPAPRESVLVCEQTVQRTQLSSRTKQTFPCLLDGCKHVCSSAGDLVRHQQSLRHRPPQFFCSGCEYGFTRPDALKRHLNNKPRCKAIHKAVTTARLGGIGDAERSLPTS